MLLLPALLIVLAPRVAVLAVDPSGNVDPDRTRRIEARLASDPSLALIDEAIVARAIAAPDVAETPPDPDAPRLLAEAKDAFYAGRAADALDRLAALKASQERTVVDASDRVRLLLWRAAAFLALNDELSAESEVTAALGIAPDLVVDLREFKPSVARVVDQVRKKLGAPVTVTIADLPPRAAVSVDGVRASSTMSLLPGTHRFSASAPGRRPWTQAVPVAVTTTLHPSLPPAADAEIVAPLGAAAAAGALDAAGRRALGRLLAKLPADFVAIAAGGRAMLVDAAAHAELFSGELAPEALADWIGASIRRAITPRAAATPKPVPTPEPFAAPRVQGPPSERGFFVSALGGLQVPQESNYTPEQVLPGGSLEGTAGWRAGLGLDLEAGAMWALLKVGSAGNARVTQPFAAVRWTPVRIGPTEASLSAGWAPVTLLTLYKPVAVSSGSTDTLRGSAIVVGAGFRRPFASRAFLAGDLRYMFVRYRYANASGSVPIGKGLHGDEVSALFGAGYRF